MTLQALLSGQGLMFLFFAVAAIASGLLVVILQNPLRAALSLVINLFSVAGLYLSLNAYFLATVQVIVYAGAIMVLFLFVIMMIDVREVVLQRFMPGGNLPAMVLIVLLGAEMLALVLWSDRFAVTSPVTMPAGGEIGRLSKTLFADYLLPFEVASVILLAALVGAIVLARKEHG